MAEESHSALRELILWLGFDLDDKGEKDIHSAIEGIKHAAIALGEAFAIKEIADFVNETVEHVAHLGDEIEKTSQRIGISVESFQELSYAAKMSGASQEELSGGLKFLSRNAAEAAMGNKELSVEFGRLGVSVTDAHGRIKPADRLLAELSNRFQKLPEGPLRTQAAMKLLGRGGTALIPLLSKGSKALAGYAQEAEELGVMSERLTGLAVEYDDAMKRNEQATQGVRNAFAEELLPTFIALKNAGTIFLAKVLRPMAHVLGAALAAAIHTVGRAFGYLRQVARPVIDGLSQLMGHFHGATSAVDLLSAAIVGIAALLAAKAAIMAVSWGIANAPLLITLGLLGALALAIGLVIQDLMSKDSIVKEWWKTWTDGWANLKEETGGTLNAITSMIETAVAYWTKKIRGWFGIVDEAAALEIKPPEGQSAVPNDMEAIKAKMPFYERWAREAMGAIVGGNPVQTYHFAPVAAGGGGGGDSQSSVSVQINANVSGGSPQENAAAIADHTIPRLEDAIRAAHQQYLPAAPPAPGK